MASSKRTAFLLFRCLLAIALFAPLLSIATADSVAAQSTVTTFPVDPNQSPFATDPTPVTAFLEANGRYYIAGDFTQVDGRTQAYVAAVNVNTGRLDTNFDPVVAGGNTVVNTIALSPDGNDLYIGGIFQTVNGVSRSRLAKIDSRSGQLDGLWNPGSDQEIESIVTDSSGVYIGGRFNTVGGRFSPNLIKVNASSGAPINNWNASTNGTVFDLELSGSNLYVGGNFDRVLSTTQNNISRLNTTTGAIGWNSLGTPDRVQSLAVSTDGSSVFAGTGGSLQNNGNGNSVFAFTSAGARAWQRVLDGDVQALEIQGNTLFVGTHGQAIFSENRFLLNGTTLNPNFPADGYGGNPNTNPNMTRREKLLSLRQGTGELLPFDPDLDSVNGVWELETGNSGLLVGGDFTEILNPDGITTTRSPIDADHVAIFANPSAPAPQATPDFSCNVTVNGNSATIRFEGDRGTSLVLRRNGSFAQTIANNVPWVTISGGAQDFFEGRVRGPNYDNPFEDIACTGGGTGGGNGGGTPVPTGGDLACTVTNSGNNAIITLTGDLGFSNNLLRNGSWIRTISGQNTVTVSGGAGDTYTARVRGGNYAVPFEDIQCSGGGGGTPVPTGGDLACTVTNSGNNAIITLTGDLGFSNNLLRNGSWIRTISGQNTVTVSGGAGDSYTARVRGGNYAVPFEDIRCN